jgi:FkbM family methyltransferase
MNQPAKGLVVNIRGGVRLCVPDALSQYTTYVLLEQEDWFEDEIRFVRHWLRPGMRAVDVGASYGIYATAMARAVGADGRVWAFEPTPQTADFLQYNLDLNQCSNAVLQRAAVSDRAGEVPFAIDVHSEVNAISGAGGRADIRVKAVTLDAAAAGWGEVDFIKFDVEGHELEAVRGAAGFFAARSPLVMLEIKVGDRIDLRALAPLRELGYSIYRLLPSRLILAPFDDSEAAEAFRLNVFACKSDRAGKLAAQGVLALDDAAGAASPPRGAWANYLRSALYARGFAERWAAKAGSLSGADARTYQEALAAYAHSLEPGFSATRQFACLAHAYQCAAEALAARATLSRRISYARLAWELGLRAVAADALYEVAQALGEEGEGAFDEPFLAPGERFERLDSRAQPADWLKCAVIEQFEKLRSYSSFSHAAVLPMVESILALPYCSAEMERRRQLVRMRGGLQQAPERASGLCERSEENLNPDFWCRTDPTPPGPSGESRAFSILSIVPDLPRLKIVDIGAMSLGEDTDPYALLLRTLDCELIGFEPLEEECEKLNRAAGDKRSYLPFAVADGREQTFYQCSAAMTSSIFEPNTALLGMFQNLEELVRVVATKRVQTKRLDDIAQARGADFLKVDVQGAELMVFQGAEETLRDVLVIQTEAEFVPLYKGQPLFADVDAFLRARGFVLHKLPVLAGRTFKPLVLVENPYAAMSQILWCDAVYVRDFMAFDRLAPDQLLKLAAILHENYGSHDLAAVALLAHDRLTGGALQPRYLQRLVAPTA